MQQRPPGQTPLPYIISIPHTGTRFLRQLLGIARRDRTCPHHHILAKSPTAHVQMANQVRRGIVVPLRDPRAVLATWIKHKRRVSDYLKSWELLEELDAKWPLLYLCVDHPKRDEQLAHLARYFELPLATDWQPVGHSEGEPTLPAVEWDEVYYRLPVSRFYEP